MRHGRMESGSGKTCGQCRSSHRGSSGRRFRTYQRGTIAGSHRSHSMTCARARRSTLSSHSARFLPGAKGAERGLPDGPAATRRESIRGRT
jgi:hypothetical protein